MAKITLSTGAEDIANMLMRIDKASDAVAKMATYEGAGVVADAIRKAAEGLPVDKPRTLKNGDRFDVLVQGDKEDLLNSIGIDQIGRDEDGVRTVVGFAGYGRHKTKKYSKGIPMPMLARSIESGSSVRMPKPFVRTTVAAKRKEAEAAMVRAGKAAIENIVKER